MNEISNIANIPKHSKSRGSCAKLEKWIAINKIMYNRPLTYAERAVVIQKSWKTILWNKTDINQGVWNSNKDSPNDPLNPQPWGLNQREDLCNVGLDSGKLGKESKVLTNIFIKVRSTFLVRLKVEGIWYKPRKKQF